MRETENWWDGRRLCNVDQIGELAKLPLGVAAVCQNDWLEPVLCRFSRFEDERPYVYKPVFPQFGPLTRFYQIFFSVKDCRKLSSEYVDGLNQSPPVKVLLREAFRGKVLTKEERIMLSYNLFEGRRLACLLENASDEAEGMHCIRCPAFPCGGRRGSAPGEMYSPFYSASSHRLWRYGAVPEPL